MFLGFVPLLEHSCDGQDDSFDAGADDDGRAGGGGDVHGEDLRAGAGLRDDGAGHGQDIQGGGGVAGKRTSVEEGCQGGHDHLQEGNERLVVV